MQLSMNGLWWVLGAAAVGLGLGAASSAVTRRLLRKEHEIAGSWWLGAVVTAALLALLAWRVGDRGAFAVYGFAAVLGVPLAVVDWCEHRLPRQLAWPQLAGVVAGFGALCLARHDLEPGVRAVGALLAAGGLVLVLAVLTNGGVGAGDIVIAAVAGTLTGWTGWPQVAGALVMAAVLALLLIVVPGAHRGDERGHATVPFGPCLFGGALIMILTGG
ncbi:leader peptidase (prepilin peptidase) / N-methyltransferase [Amycolatopsis tolypomycina]|uniref:Leader peptidase (Prepilin peptidase) / N-methyltransferase n=1 Tax=Amycolatopsis tolypomycina TaxID=208445 RepID=A0A1H4JIG1_9PSEU|nr:prepilin peptidase [Amycolatopsis tolypomycina]SEB46104.1 leader peptidase (prepilin peptidase) / N-methyltransferase [Amycolatopsis tolypomycina]